MMLSIEQRNTVDKLLALSGDMDKRYEVVPCNPSGNNRVFEIRNSTNRFAAKWYFSNKNDPRARLACEWRFLDYARKVRLNCVPRPLAYDNSANAALYSFVNGQKVTSDCVSVGYVQQAADFFCALNAQQSRESGAKILQQLSTASEARFSVAGHIEIVDQRLKRLETTSAETEVDRSAQQFIAELRSGWENIRREVATETQKLNISVDCILAPEERCISPSDFGFHNVISQPSGELCFIDFEYAGWDDPAKMVADFFLQPAVPVSEFHYREFIVQTLSYLPDIELAIARTTALRPVFGIKWCCIMLNAFDHESMKRIVFANSAMDIEKFKADQLNRAKHLYSSIMDGNIFDFH